MQRRTFLQTTTVAAAGALLMPKLAFGQTQGELPEEQLRYPYQLSDIPHSYDSFEPVIDAETMEIHHQRHHAAYVEKLNAAMANDKGLQAVSLPELLRGMDTKTPAALRNNAGGHYNHHLFWDILRPNPRDGGQKPTESLLSPLDEAFGGYEGFMKEFSKAAMGVFGSGWVWLCVMPDNSLKILTTPNQDNPLMTGLVKETGTPILALDVWEHAYYLHYQNRRKDYVDGFFTVINWDKVTERYAAAMR